MNSNAPRVTKSGATVRHDSGLGGMLCFCPQPGMIYAVTQEHSQEVTNWLDGESPAPPDTVYLQTIGQGFARTKLMPQFPAPQLLPTRDDWKTVPNPKWPLLINWFITGQCPLACRYCYAEDLMRRADLEPSPKDLDAIAESILRLNPVAVVLTGGDPLFSPNLATAIECLSGRVGLIVDTSGFTFRNDHIRLFRDHDVSLRISIDSPIPAVNDSQRPVSPLYPKLAKRGGALEAAMNALCSALDNNLGVTVQTVATKKTANDLVGLGSVLYRAGVKSWRIFKVAPSVASMNGYRALVGTHHDDGRPVKGKQKDGPYEHAFSMVLKARGSIWNNEMAVQVTMNDIPNSVILVTPDGRFVTESNVGPGKVVLDPRSPNDPSPTAVRKMVNMSGHAARYLNMT